jgi:RES domain-containing protein
VRFQGKLYRALNPIHARAPLSGHGAALYGGRFNPKGVAALYTALSVLTAIREANQAGNLQPTTIVCYEVDIARVFDTRNEKALAAFGMSAVDLADPGWRDQMKANGKAETQVFAETLIGQGYHGMIVRSFVRGAADADLNLVLWNWSDTPPARVTLIDDHGRLSAF